MSKSHHESFFEAQLRAIKAPPWVREHRFHSDRKWRFDFAFVERKVAIDIQGGGEGGAHMKYRGYRNDIEKLNAAQIDGWTFLWATGEMIWNGEALAIVERALLLPASGLAIKPAKRARRAVLPRAARGSRRYLLPQ